MDILRVGRTEVTLAVLAGVWAGGFLHPEPVAAPAAVLVGLAVLTQRRRPAVAATAVAAIDLGLGWWYGVSGENPASLAALFVVVYALGRYTTPARSTVPLAACLVALVADDPSAPTIVFGCLLLGSVWSIGAVVRRRTHAAHRAAALAAELAELDPNARAAQAVAHERARLAGEILAVIRTAVVTMLHDAEEASADLDPSALERIQIEGRRATSELRRLLGLLRSEAEPGPGPEPGSGSRPGSEPRSPASRWRVPTRGPWWPDLATAVGLIAACWLEIALTPELLATSSGLAVAVSLAMAASVALRRRNPDIACAAAAAPPALALAMDLTLPYGLWTAAVAGLLSWSVGVRGRWWDRAALGLLAGVHLLDVRQHHTGNEAITLVVIALTAVAGHLWASRDRDQRSATELEVALRAHHALVAERAVHAERLRLARELHDVTSHAVGVMVLQAGAAAAMRERHPSGAHAAIANVQTAGAQALSELDVLFGLLDAGAIGVSGLTDSGTESGLLPRVEALVARMRAAGLRVSLVAEGDRLPEHPDLTATAYRVVQEALTNVMRHAPDADVEVVLATGDDLLLVRVCDEGSPPVATASDGVGFGLVGLAERVRAHSGELHVGRRTGGGFTVEARLPVVSRQEGQR